MVIPPSIDTSFPPTFDNSFLPGDKQSMMTERVIITRSAFKSPRLIVLAISLLAVALFIAGLGLFPQKPPFIAIEAKSEILKYKVVRPELAAIPLAGARIRLPDNQCLNLPDGIPANVLSGPLLIKPAKNAIVTYRMRQAQVAIIVTSKQGSAGTVELMDEQTCKLGRMASFVFSKPEADNPSARPLPIAGPSEMGVELGAPVLPAPDSMRNYTTMLEGQVQIFGRTSLPPNRGALYPAQDAKFPLPAGGRLSSGSSIGDPAITEDDAWYGVAQIRPDHFAISASTESLNLRFYRPGKSHDAEQFAVSLLARLFKDPSVAIYSLALLIFTFVAELLALFWDLPFRSQIARHLLSSLPLAQAGEDRSQSPSPDRESGLPNPGETVPYDKRAANDRSPPDE